MSDFLVQTRLRPSHLAGVLVAAAIALAPALPSAQARPSRHVLFIGNSYTAANNLAEVVAGIAEARQAGPVIVPSMALRGGQMLDWHLHYGPAMPALDAPAHDITDVVLQEQSTLGAGDAQDDASGGQHLTIADPAEFYAGVRGLVKRIRARGATPVLFMTWARRDWPEDLEKLQKAYVSIGHELNVKVAPVGVGVGRSAAPYSHPGDVRRGRLSSELGRFVSGRVRAVRHHHRPGPQRRAGVDFRPLR